MAEIIAALGALWVILLIAVIIAWVLCPFLAAEQGAKTGDRFVAFLFGLAFGPLGVLIAVAHRMAVSVDIQAEEVIKHINKE